MVRRCAVAKLVLWQIACMAASPLIPDWAVSWLPHNVWTAALVFGAAVVSIAFMFRCFKKSCFDAIDRGEPWHYWIPKPKRPARALSLILIAGLLVGCATSNPELEQKLASMQAELDAVKAKPAEPAPQPKPVIKQTVVAIAGVKLPKQCAVVERSDIQVKSPVWAALLWCAEKPPGVTPVVVPKKQAEP